MKVLLLVKGLLIVVLGYRVYVRHWKRREPDLTLPERYRRAFAISNDDIRKGTA